MKGGLQFCRCCRKAVPRSVYEDHLEQSKLQVETEVGRLAMFSSPPNHPVLTPTTSSSRLPPNQYPNSKNKPERHGISSSRVKQASAKPSSPDIPLPHVSASTTVPLQTDSKISDSKEDRAQSVYRELRTTENEVIRRYEALELEPLLKLSTHLEPPGVSPMSRKALLQQVKDERAWMVEQMHRLQSYDHLLDVGNKEFAHAILGRLQKQIETLNDILEPRSQRPDGVPTYKSGVYLFDAVYALPPATLIVMMMAVILSLLSRATRGECNFVLGMANLAIQAATQSVEKATGIPNDIRTARKHFNLDPVVTIYAVCPSCGKLHKPTSSQPFSVYEATCQCGSKLTKISGHHNGVAIRKPIKPYVMQCFASHRARMYCRPGYEAIMRRENILLSRGEVDSVSDIREAHAYQDLKGPDNRPFVECETELRSIWSLSYDGYNPGTNKTAGKTASVGSLAMSCLSLPPSLRNRPENLYLVGLIPGPKQPTGDGLNPFLVPLIDDLHNAYHTGTFFEETYEHPEGITSREALLTVVNDLPGGRKLVGGASHSASVFCMYCSVALADINNIDMSTEAWKLKTGEDFRKAAEEWRDAPSKSKKKDLYKHNGVRWSELLRLDYWNPVQNTVIDGMHNLFLGLVRHHFREVVGTHWDTRVAEAEEPVLERPPREQDLVRARRLLDTGEATLARLERFTVPALHQLCSERAAQPVSIPGKKIHKRQLAVALLVVSTSSSAMDQDGDAAIHNLEETPVPDVFSIDLGEGPTRPARREMLDTNDLKKIQEDIKKTLRPWNQTSPPRNFGSPSHGKLKADEWRACIEFDLPVSLVKLWEPTPTEDDPDVSRKSLALESTFLLSMAIRYATSHRTSPFHQEKYLSYMRKYLQTLLELHPKDSLHPNHHNALHLPTFLELFGPIHGWWMFPFERLIGILQKFNTNFKFGELEETVLKTFCASAHLRNVLDRPDGPMAPGSSNTIFQQSLKLVQKCMPDVLKGTMLDTSGVKAPEESTGAGLKRLDPDVIEAFVEGDLRGVSVTVLNRIRQDGRVFAPRNASRPHSNIFFRPTGQNTLQPGTIREIFQHNGTVYLVVQCYLRKHVTYFDRYPDFGAEVWSQTLRDRPMVIPLSSSVYPSYLREWDQDKLILKPLIPVRPQDPKMEVHPTEASKPIRTCDNHTPATIL